MVAFTGPLALLGVVALGIQTATQQSTIDDLLTRAASLQSEQTSICSTVIETNF